MKIAIISGSPRLEANSVKLAEAAIAALPGNAHQIEKHFLNQLRFRGCQGCYSCKTKTEFCVLKDDLTKVLASAAGADLTILCSPIYIGEITGQLKCFIDRTYSWFKPDFMTNSVPGRLPSGKKLLLVITQGNPDPKAYAPNIAAYSGYFANQGFKVSSFVAPGLTNADVNESNPQFLKDVAALAAEL
ncbi:MAG: flavodoxin family protein [Deltaproteobacteria bacterium]|jgi:multimeric flavodoxin WrbA|nr:flavodoxin family protein [Deltaproteobacteria bacterium]